MSQLKIWHRICNIRQVTFDQDSIVARLLRAWCQEIGFSLDKIRAWLHQRDLLPLWLAARSPDESPCAFRIEFVRYLIHDAVLLALYIRRFEQRHGDQLIRGPRIPYRPWHKVHVLTTYPSLEDINLRQEDYSWYCQFMTTTTESVLEQLAASSKPITQESILEQMERHPVFTSAELEILEREPVLRQLYEMKNGEPGTRRMPDDKWKREKAIEDDILSHNQRFYDRFMRPRLQKLVPVETPSVTKTVAETKRTLFASPVEDSPLLATAAAAGAASTASTGKSVSIASLPWSLRLVSFKNDKDKIQGYVQYKMDLAMWPLGRSEYVVQDKRLIYEVLDTSLIQIPDSKRRDWFLKLANRELARVVGTPDPVRTIEWKVLPQEQVMKWVDLAF